MDTEELPDSGGSVSTIGAGVEVRVLVYRLWGFSV